jgi:hypothetical protein
MTKRKTSAERYDPKLSGEDNGPKWRAAWDAGYAAGLTAAEAEHDKKWKTIGQVGVDSGNLLVCDPCYVDKDLTAAVSAYLESGGKGGAKGWNKKHACNSAITDTGLGDGIYDVEARHTESGATAEIRVQFIPHALRGDLKQV